MVLPAGSGDDGLPVGVRLVGKRWEDERLLAVAAALLPITGGFRPPTELG